MQTKSPADIKSYLDHYIIGQEEAKITLSTALFMHMVRCRYNHLIEEGEKHDLPRQNALVLGPSGSGKTYMVQKACEYLGLPCCTLPALSISPEGWHGTSFSEHMADFREKIYNEFQNPDYAALACRYAVIFIDEIDKICIPAVGSGGSDHNKLIQHTLLKYIEGQSFMAHTPGAGKHHYTRMHTDQMLFICAGHFEEMFEKREKQKRSIGFASREDEKLDVHQEIAACGMIPELLGRLAILTETKKLSKDDLRRVILDAEDSSMKRYESLFRFLGEPLVLTDEEVDKLVNYCYTQPVGVRGLSYIIHEHVKERIFKMRP